MRAGSTGWRSLGRDQRGAGMIEYLLVIATVVALLAVAYTQLSRGVKAGADCEGQYIASLFTAKCGGGTTAEATGRATAHGAATQPVAGANDLVCGKMGCREGSNNCFAAGTLVHTATGLRPIESIEAGEKVLGTDEETRAEGLRAVERVVVTPSKELMDLVVSHGEGDIDGDRETLRVTPEHAFWVEGKEWVRAGELVTGDSIRSVGGAGAVVRETRRTHEVATVYNLEVDQVHTYHVGRRGLLGRSACERAKPTAALRARASEGPLWSTSRSEALWKLAACRELVAADWDLLADAMQGEAAAKVDYVDAMTRAGNYTEEADLAAVDAIVKRHWFERAELALEAANAAGDPSVRGAAARLGMLPR